MSTNVAYQISSHKRVNEEASSVRVALVDDDELFREALGMNLVDEGYDVVSFGGGEGALNYFRDDGGTARRCASRSPGSGSCAPRHGSRRNNGDGANDRQHRF